MTIKRRIEHLESKHISSDLGYVIISFNNETDDEAKQRYCAETGIEMNELEAREDNYLIIRLVPLEKSGCIKVWTG